MMTTIEVPDPPYCGKTKSILLAGRKINFWCYFSCMKKQKIKMDVLAK
jgi:hypothetical protein